MDEAEITRYITSTFDGVQIDTSTPDTFFFHDPDRKFPFATVVTRDNEYDHSSNLDRPSVFRLSIGVSKQTYQSLFGAGPSGRGIGDVGDTVHDFTVLDKLLPHPVYGRMYWVCILNPSATTFQTAVQPLLAEAYEKDVSKYAKRGARG